MKNLVQRSIGFPPLKKRALECDEGTQDRHNEEGGSSIKQSRLEFCSNDVISDPALRKPINEYDASIIANVRCEYVKRGPCQPRNHNFPKTFYSNENRMFQKNWFDNFPWLEYSVSNDAAYCFPWYVFKDPTSNDDYSVDGVKTWKNALNSFRKHQKHVDGKHNIANGKLKDFSNPNQRIPHFLEVHGREVEEAYRIRLNAILNVIRFLLKQGLAFRGHDESIGSLNKGNFLELVDWYCNRSEDIAKVIHDAPGNNKLTSPLIQKQLSHACAEEVSDAIIDDIGDSVFSILIDEARDCSIKEQMGLVLRYVNKKGCVLERFLSLVHVNDTKSTTLFRALKTLIGNKKLSLSRCRGQGYDGASNMRGEFNGLKALMLKENSSARYIHCFSHQLQLVVVSVANSTLCVCEFFSYLVDIVNLVGGSCVRKDMLNRLEHDRVVEALEKGDNVSGRGKNQEMSLRRPGDTRWGSHYTTILRFEVMWSSIDQVLLNICEYGNSAENASKAKGLMDRMDSYEFVFCMFLMKHLLGVTSQLSLALQQRDQNIVQAVQLMNTMKVELREFRAGGFEVLLNKVETFCKKHEITVCQMEDQRKIRHRSRRRGQMETNGDFYRVDIFLQTVDNMIVEMNDRFSEASSELLTCIACLDPRDSFSRFDVGRLVRLGELYPNDFSRIDCLQLEQELNTFIHDVRHNNASWPVINDLGCFAQHMVQSRSHVIFPLLYHLIQLALVIPVATASVERVFSGMKKIKTDLRNRVGDEWLNDIMRVYVEKEVFVKIENEAIMQRYQKSEPRRINLPPLPKSACSIRM